MIKKILTLEEKVALLEEFLSQQTPEELYEELTSVEDPYGYPAYYFIKTFGIDYPEPED